MYEAIEHYKVYKQKQLAKQSKINKAIDDLMTKDISHKEFDKQLNKLTASN